MDLGKIQKIRRKSLIKTAHKWIDENGKRRYHGTKSLKSTQFPSFKVVEHVFSLLRGVALRWEVVQIHIPNFS